MQSSVFFPLISPVFSLSQSCPAAIKEVFNSKLHIIGGVGIGIGIIMVRDLTFTSLWFADGRAGSGRFFFFLLPLHRSLGWSLAWCSAVPSRGPGTTSEEPTHALNSYLPLLKFVLQSHVSLDPYRMAKSTYESVEPLIFFLSNSLPPALKTLNRIKGYF